MAFETSSFSRQRLADWCVFVSEQARTRCPAPTPLMTSDIAWQLPGADPKANVRFWYTAGEMIAYCWFQPPVEFHFDTRGDYTQAVLPELFAWAITRRLEFPEGTLPYLYVTDMAEWSEVPNNPAKYMRDTGRVLVAPAFDHDEATRRIMVEHGFEPTEHTSPHMLHELNLRDQHKDDIVVRSIEPAEMEQYCAAHRDAWLGSTFNVDRLQAVASVGGVYDPELCLIAEVDGEIAGTTIFWVDASGIGDIEPFGVRPSFRGRGVSQALILAGLRRIKHKGMRYCRVYTAGFNHQAQRLYQASGFETVGIARSYKRIC